MTVMTQPSFAIVVGVDLGQFSSFVVEHALDQGARHDAPELHFLTVVDRADEIEATKQRLADLVVPAISAFASPVGSRDRSDWSLRLHVRAGKIAEELAALAAEVGARLMVIGRFGRHHPYRRLAKTAADIVDLAPCPVLVTALVDDPPRTSPICPDCAKVRVETHGERWFCAQHRGDRVSTRVPFGGGFTGSNQLW
ncbi:MAG: universal stress protein [Kofleriaceae bacterium]